MLRDTELYTWFGTYYKAIYSANPCFINPCFVAHVDALALMRYRVLQKATIPSPPGLGKVVESGEFIGNCFLSSGLRFGLSQR